ncbi:unnamed protein product, partial [Oppiella nova]
EKVGMTLAIIKELAQNLLGLRNKYSGNTRLDGQVVVITGANQGIGKETAYQLSLRGAKIIIGCRDELRAENAIKEIVSRNPNANIIHIKLDLSSLHEYCLGHYLLTLQLLPLLRKAPKARIINVSSSVYASGKINFENINLRNGAFEMWTAYSQSKLANVLFTRELAKRLGDTTINAYSLHPGIINTEWYRHIESPVGKFIAKNFTKMFAISIERGTQTTLYCALEESLDNESGFYYDNCLLVDNMYANATDDKSAEKLWELSADLVKLEDKYRLPKHI